MKRRNVLKTITTPLGSAARTIGKWSSEYALEMAILLGGSTALFWIHGTLRPDRVDLPAAGQSGDFVAGYLVTFFALLTAVLVIKTLKEQRRSGESEKFETTYLELIKMHRDNVAEMRLQKITGRRIF